MKENLQFNYIFVNDGSKDKTLEVLRKISDKFENVHYLSFSRNFGKEAALLVGLKEAKGDFVAIMDADLQDPPEMLTDMYRIIQHGFDIVRTKRIVRRGEPIIK